MQTFKRSLFLVVLFSLPAAVAGAADDGWVSELSLSTSTIARFGSSARSFRDRGAQPGFTFRAPTKTGSEVVTLIPHDIRSADYQSEMTGDGGTVPDPTQVELFKGTSETGESFFRFMLVTDPASGEQTIKGYYRADGTYYRLSPIEGGLSGYKAESLTSEEMADLGRKCGVEIDADFTVSGSGVKGLQREVGAAGLLVADIATEADFEFFNALGGEAGANAEILGILNAVDSIYQAQIGVRFQVTFQHVWTTSSDPYTTTSAGPLLDQFVSYWQTNYSGNKVYDVSHFWTGKDLDGGTAGIAYISAVCTSVRYGITQRFGFASVDVVITAHELGHNFGAQHDASGSPFIMNASVNPGANQFSPGSISSMTGFAGNASCLTMDGGGGGGGGGGGNGSPPVLAAIGARSVNENVNLAFSISATDPEGGAITYSASGLPAGATFNGQNFSYTPSFSVASSNPGSVTVNVTFTATDSAGLTDSEVVPVTVVNVNRAPTIQDPSSQNTSEGQVFTFQFSASDPDNDPFSFRANGTFPAGIFFDSSTGLLSWRPSGSQSGNYAFSISVVDSSGATDTTTLGVLVANVPGVPAHPAQHSVGDFDGVNGAEVGVFRGLNGIWYTAPVGTSAFSSTQFGLPNDVPVPGDYDGDNVTDYGVFRPSSSTWFVRFSSTGVLATRAFGVTGDIPVPGGDYDGDGRDDLAIFRPAAGLFVYRGLGAAGADNVVGIGMRGDIPVPADYDGDGRTNIAVFRPTGNFWWISQGGSVTGFSFGAADDIPVPADYDGDGRAEVAVFRSSTGEWINSSTGTSSFGEPGDVPVPSDYDGDGDVDLAVWTPAFGRWSIRNAGSQQLGLPSDLLPTREWYYYAAVHANDNGTQGRTASASALIYQLAGQSITSLGPNGTIVSPLPALRGSYIFEGDYNGDGSADRVVFINGIWTKYMSTGQVLPDFWGTVGDVPIAADFDGDRKTDLAIYRPNDGTGFSRWIYVRSSDATVRDFQWGVATDMPIPGDYNGDGRDDLAVWRPSEGNWYVFDTVSQTLLERVQWGLGGDTVHSADINGDGRDDKIIWRPFDGGWYIRFSDGTTGYVQWGAFGDVPILAPFLTAGSADFAVWRPSERRVLILGRNGGTYIANAPALPRPPKRRSRRSPPPAPVVEQVVGVAPYMPVL